MKRVAFKEVKSGQVFYDYTVAHAVYIKITSEAFPENNKALRVLSGEIEEFDLDELVEIGLSLKITR